MDSCLISKLITRLVLITIVLQGVICNGTVSAPEREERTERFNSPCTTENSRPGTCMKRSDCLRNNGVANGFCGTYGICCETTIRCGGISTAKRTTITTPAIVPQTCSYHFQPYSRNVCQLRIDFNMTLAQPRTVTGTTIVTYNCDSSYFLVGDVKICGINRNQHLYLPFNPANGFTDATITIVPGTEVLPFWNIVVTQLECTSPKFARSNEDDETFETYLLKTTSANADRTNIKYPNPDLDLIAPNGCHQYFPDRSGVFESFNFNNGAGLYPPNLKYSICFRRLATDTAIQFTGTTFQLGRISATNMYVDTDCIGADNLSRDFLVVPESQLMSSTSGTRYCGTSLNNRNLLYTPAGPFVISFYSDNKITPPTTMPPPPFREIGFRISYVIQ